MATARRRASIGGKHEGQNLSRRGHAFSATAFGLELLYSYLLHEHALPSSDADLAVEEAVIEERVDPIPRELPRCH